MGHPVSHPVSNDTKLSEGGAKDMLVGFRGLFSSPYIALCAAFSAIGGILFGYDQGVISVTLVMDHFLERFPEVADDAPVQVLRRVS
jgi:hypothetical protein